MHLMIQKWNSDNTILDKNKIGCVSANLPLSIFVMPPTDFIPYCRIV
jgi:hypothetical protein